MDGRNIPFPSRHLKAFIEMDIIDRKFRQVIVSPEIATSTEFLRDVLSQNHFSESIRLLNIDEAHCMNIWGGSFRPDYAKLGILRGCFKGHSMLNDVCSKLRLSKNLKVIQLTNSRPNVALSVRTMQHPEASKADLRFIIPVDATKASDIPITLVYCNKRKDMEECVDRMREWAVKEDIDLDCIAFYYALIGEKRKRKIEELLGKGDIRVLFCTEALGMGCDLRNISSVVLCGLPLTFCRDLETDGEAILIVPKSVMKENITSAVNEAVETVSLEAESFDRVISDEEVEMTTNLLSDEGIRLVSEDENKDQLGEDTNISKSCTLLAFVQTKACRRIPWDTFFENAKKLQLIYDHCCDNCQLSLFPVETVTTFREEKGLKRGKKNKVLPEEAGYIRNKLNIFRELLMDKMYGKLTSLSASTLLDDGVIEAIATCGECLQSYLCRVANSCTLGKWT
ncbi:hypothetical protein BDN70DRAFT_970895 [Pholiota conissans]|uniref:DNA 3'-5' helicase n=1 Tax=Pholiota conissans TaxID=109636 RepID=A0A9P5YR52_9AGAR|nr:hypothetical protein BDN70DRAFT_970895 [Pholiota conissans]